MKNKQSVQRSPVREYRRRCTIEKHIRGQQCNATGGRNRRAPTVARYSRRHVRRIWAPTGSLNPHLLDGPTGRRHPQPSFVILDSLALHLNGGGRARGHRSNGSRPTWVIRNRPIDWLVPKFIKRPDDRSDLFGYAINSFLLVLFTGESGAKRTVVAKMNDAGRKGNRKKN